jgi:hypothetical protein
MASNVADFPFGRLHLSRITYICDLQKNYPIIPLGVIAEIRAPNVRVLGLIARARLSDDETKLVGSLYKSGIATPFDFIKSDFEWLAEERERSLKDLVGSRSQSFSFAVPQEQSVRLLASKGPVAKESACDELRKWRDKEFWAMLAELRPDPSNVDRVREISDLAA